MKFVQFIENNDHEGESWCSWLQLDGNEAELEKLDKLLDKFEEGGEVSYQYTGIVVDESEVDTLVKYGNFDTGYGEAHTKVTGKFTCPEIDQTSWENEIPDEAFEWLDDQFYKGDITNHFETK